jgi:hypothetical protein
VTENEKIIGKNMVEKSWAWDLTVFVSQGEKFLHPKLV